MGWEPKNGARKNNSFLNADGILPREGQPFDEQGGSMARRRYQEGRVFLRGRKTPKWIGRWREDVIMPDGSIRRVERSMVLGKKHELATERLARRRLETVLARVNAPEYRPGRMGTVAEFAERWQELFLKHRKPSTVKAACSNLKHHILPVLGKMGLDQLGREVQQEFAVHLCRSVSRKTAVNILGTLSSMLGTAKAWGYVCQTVDVAALALPEKPRAEARFFTADQARQIIAAAEHPFRAMFAVAAMTGMRAGEIMGLSVDDLDFGRRLIHVRRSAWHGRLQTVKTQASNSVLPMPEPLARILREHLATWQENPERLVFRNRRGRPYTGEKVVQKRLWPILDSLGIPRCGFHAFRHLHASLLLEAGASPKVAQAQLRHSDARITLGVYGHVVGDSQRSAVERVAEILRPVLRPIAPKLEGSGQYIQ
jgi:integrase